MVQARNEAAVANGFALLVAQQTNARIDEVLPEIMAMVKAPAGQANVVRHIVSIEASKIGTDAAALRYVNALRGSIAKLENVNGTRQAEFEKTGRAIMVALIGIFQRGEADLSSTESYLYAAPMLADDLCALQKKHLDIADSTNKTHVDLTTAKVKYAYWTTIRTNNIMDKAQAKAAEELVMNGF